MQLGNRSDLGNFQHGHNHSEPRHQQKTWRKEILHHRGLLRLCGQLDFVFTVRSHACGNRDGRRTVFEKYLGNLDLSVLPRVRVRSQRLSPHGHDGRYRRLSGMENGQTYRRYAVCNSVDVQQTQQRFVGVFGAFIHRRNRIQRKQLCGRGEGRRRNYRQEGSHRRCGRAHQRDSRRSSGLHAKQGVGNLLPAAGALHAGKFFGNVLL